MKTPFVFGRVAIAENFAGRESETSRFTYHNLVRDTSIIAFRYLNRLNEDGLKSLILAVWIAVCVSVISGCKSDRENTNDRALAQLDSLISKAPILEQSKSIELADLRLKRSSASTPSDRYMANKLLFGAFETYSSDSALKYIDENIAIAAGIGNEEWETRSKIDKAEVLTASGMLSESLNIMNSIDHSKMPAELKTCYFGQMIFLYSHLGNYAGGDGNGFYAYERAYKDSIMNVIQPSHPDYLWYTGWDVLGTDKAANQVIDALSQKLSNAKFSSRQDAKDAYILAKLYESIGDTPNYKKYLIKSAMSDVRIANAEIASLEDLAKIMFAEGDIDHAYAYIKYSLDKALAYPNRVKAYGILSTMDIAYTALQDRNAKLYSRTNYFLVSVCVLAAILVASIVVVIVQNNKLRRSRRSLDDVNKSLSHNNRELSETHRQLNEVNSRLKQLNEDLEHKNEELQEANYVKEEYIGSVFAICSNYIGKIESLTHKIHNMMVAKDYRRVESMTDDFDIKAELKELYQSFDTIFLHIYPNFIDDFNSLLEDDKRIVPKEGELLNTELRIYALVRLGITDSVKIADFLHCSAQTVYNYRFKVRNKAKISKKEFADTVRTLGTFKESI